MMKAGKLLAVSAPLFLSVALDKLLVDMGSHKADGLLFQVLRLALDDLSLLIDDSFLPPPEWRFPTCG